MLENKNPQTHEHAPPVAGRVRYEVAPMGELWRIKLTGDGFTEYAHTRADAVARAKHVAKRATSGLVIVLDAQGKVVEEHEVKGDRPAAI